MKDTNNTIDLKVAARMQQWRARQIERFKDEDFKASLKTTLSSVVLNRRIKQTLTK